LNGKEEEVSGDPRTEGGRIMREDERVIGRFSTGQEEDPGRASVRRTGCFADGSCDPGGSPQHGRFSSGLETVGFDPRIGSFGDVDRPEREPIGPWKEVREADLGRTMA
jgi:hypothetical protein